LTASESQRVTGPPEAAPKEIRGNTLKVYLEVLRHGPSELRDVQRAVGLSTPSLASYHLGKLLDAGYVRQDEYKRYVASADGVGEVLAGYSKVGTTIVPQLAFFAILFSILICYFSFEALSSAGYVPLLVATAGGSAVVLWYETLRVWRRLAP
jgi:DNA-binding transcriptional ArsR family regulator